uniref:Uncharacterized protein LOC105111556 n=1 Tax=Rhizophora mucronata TaxID=61149 RepID=A0A2P2JJ40_RHIMU
MALVALMMALQATCLLCPPLKPRRVASGSFNLTLLRLLL